jgi:ABC-2 type transport system permease protein
MGLVFRSDGAATLASISLTFFGFFGNVFMPLDGTMLDIARFTPMYGVVALARWPLTDGVLTTGQTDQPWASPSTSSCGWSCSPRWSESV